MGRLVGIPHFMSTQAWHEQLSDTNNLRRARQDREDSAEAIPPDQDPVRSLQVTISERMQSKFEGRVIRRTAQSLDADGTPLITLPPLSIIHGVLKLSQRELEILESITLESLSEYVNLALYLQYS